MAFPENTVNDIGIKHIWDKVTAALSGKVDKVSGKGLSTNDYTTIEKNKLAGIESGAQVNAVTSVAGKIGAVTLDKADVGLGNVDNTSDANKPISTATQNALDTKADASDVAGTQTATGNPITITDAAGINAEALKVTFSPKQDLHGYDFPWVGGAGKNKLDITTSSSAQFTRSGEVFTNVVIDTRDFFNLQIRDSNTTLFGIAIRSTGVIVSDVFTISNDTSSISIRHSGSQVDLMIFFSQTIKAGSYKLVIDVTGYNSSVVGGLSFKNVMLIPSTETNTDFAPYSNICPITGYTECEVDDVGKNEFDPTSIEQGTYSGTLWTLPSGTGTAYSMTFKANTQYTFSGTSTQTKANKNLRLQIVYTDNTTTNLWATNATTPVDFAVTSESGKSIASVGIARGSAGGSVLIDKLQIEEGTTATSYEPYHSSNATIQFGQTVYGGKSDFVEGGTEKKHANIVFDGSEDENLDFDSTLNQLIIGDISPLHKNGTAPIVDKLKGVAVSGWNSLQNGELSFHPTNGAVARAKLSNLTSLADWKTWLASNPIQIVYELAAPTTIATPKTDLKLLQDTNNLTTNGTTIILDYIPNNSIGDAVKASEEYTDRAVEGKADNTTAYVDLPGNYDTTNKNFPTRSATSGSVENCLTYINDLADKLYTAINSHATALANIPTKTVVVNHRAIDVGDEFNISLPLSYKFLIIELTIILTDELCYGSIVSTDFANGSGLSIVANGHGLSYWCDLSRMANTITIDGNFDSAHGELTITAF